MLNNDQLHLNKLGLIIIKLPNAPFHLFPISSGKVRLINKLTLKRASNKYHLNLSLIHM